ncbi:hypothetical protein AGMMS50267_06530 [Spirochaetia bacterium]|nr:hypothetical protein AGMMS50267_06530 [Spirochaetia bacterium]
MRNELKFSRKIYFYDNGIRNALIANFSIPELRNDVGPLWENFLVSERKKRLEYEELVKNTWFWRTTDQKEIDYLEEGNGAITAYEFKWNPAARYKRPKAFLEHYPQSSFEVITPNNVEDFLLPE